MKTIEIIGSLRKETGKKDSKQLRKEEKVPCVLYGGENVVHFMATEKDFKPLIHTPHVYLVKLNLEGKIYDAVLQEVQYHPVSDNILHIDFLQMIEDKKVSIEVPIKLRGFAVGVKEGGKLSQDLRKVKLSALPKYLPDEIYIDVDNLAVGQSIRVADLAFENINILTAKGTPIASVKFTRAAKEVTPGAPGTEAAPAAETPGKE